VQQITPTPIRFTSLQLFLQHHRRLLPSEEEAISQHKESKVDPYTIRTLADLF